MKKLLLVIVCSFAILILLRSASAFQEGKQQRELRVWTEQATPVATEAVESQYDPTEIAAGEIEQLKLSALDEDRDREIPLLVYLPSETSAAEVILYSHGLGGTRNTAAYLGQHWAGRGYVAVFMQHPGSDDSVWKDAPKLQRFQAMKGAATPANFKLRVADVPAVIDQLEKWNKEPDHSLQGRMNMKKIGMSGHSFGAITAQHVGGQSIRGKLPYFDSRISACIPMSPSSPRFGNVEKAFGTVTKPWLCMTGTDDKSVLGGSTVEDRLSIFPALPDSDKYELVLFEAEHSAFTESIAAIERLKRNPNHHPAIQAISSAFWDAYLRDDEQAKQWLTSEAPRSVLETKDRWQFK